MVSKSYNYLIKRRIISKEGFKGWQRRTFILFIEGRKKG